MANVKFLTGTETNLLKKNSDGSYVNPIVEGSLYVTAEKVSGVWVSNLYYDINGQRIKVADTSGKAMYDHMNNNIAQTYIKKITMEGTKYASTDGATLTYTTGDNVETTILLPLASTTKAGTVNTGAQTFAGNKTFMGQVILQGGTDTAAGTANSGALIIGSPTGAHISVDANEIQAKSSGTASAQLHINNDGGITQFGGNVQPKTDNTLTLGTEKLRWKTIEAVTVNATTFNGALNGNVKGNLDGNAATADKWYTARTITLGSDLQGSVSIDGSKNVTLNAQHYNVSCSSSNKSNYPWHRIATTGAVTGNNSDKDMTIIIRHTYNGGGYGVAKVSLRTNSGTSVATASVKWLYRYNIAKDSLQIGLRNTAQNALADLYYKVGTWARATIYQVEGNRSWTLIASSEVSDTTTSDKKTSKEVYTSVSNGNTLLGAGYTSTIEAVDCATVQNANYATSADGAITDNANNAILTHYLSKIDFDGTTNKTTKVVVNLYNGSGAIKTTVDFPTASASQAGAITTGTQTLTGAKTLDSNGSLTIQKSSGFNYSGIGTASDAVARHVWFSHSSNKGMPILSDKFKYNPASTDAWATVVANATDKTSAAYGKLIVDVLEGIAARAYADDRGQQISKKYVASLSFDGTTNKTSKVTMTYNDGIGAEIATVNFPTASASSAGAITTGTQTLTGAKTLDANGSLTIQKASGFNYSGIENASSDSARHVWFSHASNVGTPVKNDKFKLNPGATDTWATVVANATDKTGSAYSKLIVDVLEGMAARAYADDRGQKISTKYVSSMAFSGTGSKVTLTYNDGAGAEISSTDVPVASTSKAGVITTGTQSIAGNKTFTGRVYIKNTSDAALATADAGALVIGDKTGEHIIIDSNEIMAKATGTTSRELLFQWDGGDSGFGGMVLPKTDKTSSVGSSSRRWNEMFAYIFNAATKFTTGGGTFYADSDGDGYFANSVGLRVAPDDNYALKIAGNTFNNGIVYFGNGTTNYVNNSADARFNTVGINGSNTTYRLYVNGNTLNNGIVYFANGTTYYINNSADSRLRYVGVGSLAPNSSYALRIGGNVYLNGIHYFANGTTYYVNNSGVAHFKQLLINGGSNAYDFSVSGTGYIASDLTVDGDVITKGNFKNPNGVVSFVQNNTIVNATTDWNTLTIPGCYKVQMSAWGDAATYHSPNSAQSNLYTYGLLFVLKGSTSDSENRTLQIYFPHNTDTTHPNYCRMLNGTTWQAWHKFHRGALDLTGGTMTGTINAQHIYPKTDNTYNNGSSTKRWKEIHGYTIYAHTKFQNPAGSFYADSNGRMYVQNGTGLGVAPSTDGTYILKVTGNSLFNGVLYFANGTTYYIDNSAQAKIRGIIGDLYMRTANSSIHWDDGTYQQRIATTDDSTANTNVFMFQQSADTGSTWTNLLKIRDNGVVDLLNNAGQLRKYYSASNTTPAIMIGSNNLNINAIRIGHTSDGESWSTGYTVKYLGASDGVNNRLELWCDGNGAANNAGTEQIGISVNQGGYVGIGVAAQTAYRLYVNGPSYLNGITNIVNGQEASSATTGTLRVTGGISVSANSWFGGNITVGGYINAALGFGVTQSDGIGKGISLYGTYAGTTPTYGIMFAKTATFGTLGGVTSDWATYFTMSDTNNRGWIFRRKTTGTTAGAQNVFSIDTYGKLYSHWAAAVDVYHRAKNSLRDIALLTAASGNAGLYDYTRGVWLIYTRHSDSQTELYNNTYTKHLYPATNNTYTLGHDGLRYAHLYLTGRVHSSLSTSTHIAGNQGTAIINSTAAGTGYNMLARMKSTNGVWTFGSYGTNFNFYYTADTTISAGTNGVTKTLTLLNESGNSTFPGNVTAPKFIGALQGNATTATTLQTARTINGTSFNGSTNIVTSYWGTARTITIGNTSKVVNGSTDYNWTPYQIGMTRAQYNVGSNMNQIADHGCEMGMASLSSGNANIDPNAQTSWHHYINITWSDCKDNNGSTTNEWCTQIANKAGTTDLWVRSRAGGSITDGTAWAANWTKILTAANYTGTLDGRYVNVTGDTMTGSLTNNARMYCNEWIQFNGTTGLYFPNGNGGHFYPNTASSYGTFMMAGTRGGYFGYLIGNNTGYMCLMDSGVHKGLYQESQGRWLFYYNRDNQLIGLGGSSVDGNFRVMVNGGGLRADGLIMSYCNGHTTYIGAQNSSYSHFQTSAPQFYMNKSLFLDGTLYWYPNTGYYWNGNAGYSGTYYTNNWFRSYSATGWYNETYGGGIFMQDTTWVRIYNDKLFYVSSTNQSAIHTAGGIDARGEVRSFAANSFRLCYGSKPVILRNDGADFYILISNNSNAGDNWITPSGGGHPMRINLTTGYIYTTRTYGAVWNDYAEFRKAESKEPGRVVIETKFGDMQLSTTRLQPGGNIISDTYGYAIGETKDAKTPIAVSGRVLAYPYEDRESYEPGDAVCTGPNGTVSKMTREEIREYPERIIGTVSEIPTYEVWGQDKTKVNGRIWVKVK